MLETKEMYPEGYYMMKSVSCGRNCYFENEEEARIFRVLLKRYLGKIVDIHKLYLSSAGYEVLIKIKCKSVLIREYRKHILKKEREIDKRFIEEPWRILSEQMRIFHSVYVRMVNKMRDRQGVLVQYRYKRYLFESKEEYEEYGLRMDNGEEVINQRNVRYRVSMKWKSGVDWDLLRGVEFLKNTINSKLQNHVVLKLLQFTLKMHFNPT